MFRGGPIQSEDIQAVHHPSGKIHPRLTRATKREVMYVLIIANSKAGCAHGRFHLGVDRD